MYAGVYVSVSVHVSMSVYVSVSVGAAHFEYFKTVCDLQKLIRIFHIQLFSI